MHGVRADSERTMKLRRDDLIASLIRQFGGRQTGTLILTQDLLTQDGTEWETAVGIWRALRPRARVERRSLAEVRSALRILHRKRWVRRRQAFAKAAFEWSWGR